MCPNVHIDDTQVEIAKKYKKAIEDAFDNIEGTGVFYFAHAASILRQVADDLEY
jgi:hypothetical protein